MVKIFGGSGSLGKVLKSWVGWSLLKVTFYKRGRMIDLELMRVSQM